VLLWTLAVMGASAAWAQGVTCPPYKQENLKPLPEIQAQNGVLSTTFTVTEQPQCIPVWDTTLPTPQWTMKLMQLRTYDWPGAPTDTQPPRRIPGPTLRVRRASQPGATDGDRLQINLINRLPVSTTPDTQCDTCPAGTNCTAANAPMCCTAQDKYPECFHGDNTTNLHFHGTHVSPQAPQDYVLLQLMPEGSSPSTSSAHAHGSDNVVVGQYQYAVDMFPWDQAEGTHWYHPHKHGSVGLQLSNGMSGALLIVGPFDDWLNGFYQSAGGLTEQVLVVQQIDATLNFFKPRPAQPLAPPQPLINGQANPIVTMQPGEVQRWRFAAETTTGTTQLEITFPTGFTIKQIAQDGIQFAPQNYQNQPLLSQGLQSFTLAPGNRADFLVQAPTTPVSQLLTFRVIGNVAESVRQQTQAQQRLLAQSVAATTPPLLTVQVSGTPKPMPLPTPQQWPPMPSFLADIQDAEVVNLHKPRTLTFSMQGTPGQQPNAFFINNKQFDASCVDLSMQIGTAEVWVVQNSSAPQHPFHIHTNPFQITQVGTQALPAPWIWWDTFALPAVATTSQDVNAGPIFNNQEAQQKCPGVCSNTKATWNGQWTTTVPGQMSVCGCLPWGTITMRSRFRDYTGEYVIHCHYLGHEDRGMMLATQAVCPPVAGQPAGLAFYGTPQAGGQPDACRLQDLKPAKPLCSGS
jgi:FtsP/CotA-like multicopper oxidase with cupredoxin domain